MNSMWDMHVNCVQTMRLQYTERIFINLVGHNST